MLNVQQWIRKKKASKKFEGKEILSPRDVEDYISMLTNHKILAKPISEDKKIAPKSEFWPLYTVYTKNDYLGMIWLNSKTIRTPGSILSCIKDLKKAKPIIFSGSLEYRTNYQKNHKIGKPIVHYFNTTFDEIQDKLVKIERIVDDFESEQAFERGSYENDFRKFVGKINSVLTFMTDNL